MSRARSQGLLGAFDLFRIRGTLLLLTALALAGPARAQDASFFDLFSTTPQATTAGWQATVTAAPVAAKDPLWTAVVYARRGSNIDTGSIQTASLGPADMALGAGQDAGKAARINSAAPSLTGHTHALVGTASYYWQDQMTASGEVFNKRDMTAAHKTLPLGSRVKVTNLGNGRSTVVRINDRGPYIGGRIIDLSEAAADVLDMRTQGLAPVRVDLVGR